MGFLYVQRPARNHCTACQKKTAAYLRMSYALLGPGAFFFWSTQR